MSEHTEQTELEKMSRTETYIGRYFEFEDAVTVSLENKEYLKTYIKDINQVVKDFNVSSQTKKSIALCALIAVIVFVLFCIPFHSIILVPIIAAVAVLILGTVFVVALHRYRLTAAQEHQKEVNDGIAEQIEILNDRIKQLERQRDDYLKALDKKLDFMSADIDYMKNIKKIKSYLENGEADTCEDAVAIFEQNLLMAQMTDIISKSEKAPTASHEENLERFGDPLKAIKEKKKKKRKEKKAK